MNVDTDTVLTIHGPLSKRWARILVSCWDEPVLRPSTFEERLFALIAHADTTERGKIGLGYPEAVELANLWNHTRGASALIRDLART